MKDQINPVTGCFELPRQNPLEGMSEEQKEYEVMQIVNQLDRMTRSGVIRPGRIDENGRVVPVEHVLELQQDNLDPSKARRNDERNSSDEDD